MPKVSVIIPNFNHGRYLRKRITSVLEQTYRDFEVLCLDDASTDDSRSVFEEFKGNEKIRFLFNERNSGSPFRQWHKGISETRGDYIWIAESDDYASKLFLETLVAILDAHPDVGLSYCKLQVVDQDGNSLGTYQYHENPDIAKHWESDFINPGIDECRQYLFEKNTIPNASAVVFRRSLYQQVTGPERELSHLGDWLLWINILQISRVAYRAQPLAFFRSHQFSHGSSSRQNSKKLEEMLTVIKYVLKQFDNDHSMTSRAGERVAQDWLVNLIWHLPGSLSPRYNVQAIGLILQFDRFFPWRVLLVSLQALKRRLQGLLKKQS